MVVWYDRLLFRTNQSYQGNFVQNSRLSTSAFNQNSSNKEITYDWTISTHVHCPCELLANLLFMEVINLGLQNQKV